MHFNTAVVITFMLSSNMHNLYYGKCASYLQTFISRYFLGNVPNLGELELFRIIWKTIRMVPPKIQISLVLSIYNWNRKFRVEQRLAGHEFKQRQSNRCWDRDFIKWLAIWWALIKTSPKYTPMHSSIYKGTLKIHFSLVRKLIWYRI